MSLCLPGVPQAEGVVPVAAKPAAAAAAAKAASSKRPAGEGHYNDTWTRLEEEGARRVKKDSQTREKLLKEKADKAMQELLGELTCFCPLACSSSRLAACSLSCAACTPCPACMPFVACIVPAV